MKFSELNQYNPDSNMVCIQCYLPPILFMLYMKFLNPFVQPYIQPIFDRVVTYFWGPDALNSSCPIRQPSSKAKKKDSEVTSSGDTSSKTKDD